MKNICYLLGRQIIRTRCLKCWGIIPNKRFHTDRFVGVDFVQKQEKNVQRLFSGIKAGDRSCLAEAITLTESSHPKKFAQGQAILSLILQEQKLSYQKEGKKTLSFRAGLSGSPGAGKSTFIEVLGKHLTSQGHKVAVLAIDPSSAISGGSLLGDKTRMPELSRDKNAYIRPTPASGKLGGVSRSTHEAIVLCEAAGYDMIFIETVGVGQSEYQVVEMVDMFMLLVPPGAGDELQAMKRGIMELSDLIIVTKADGNLLPAARRIQYEYTSALKFIKPRCKLWKPKIIHVSAMQNEGIKEMWEIVKNFRQIMLDSGELEARRHQQLKLWLWSNILDNFIEVFKRSASVSQLVKEYEKKIWDGTMTPNLAANLLLKEFLKIS